VIITDDEDFNRQKEKIEEAIQIEMEEPTEVIWQPVNDIPLLKSGKYLYVYSKISE
jgi:hypothetical protein